MSHFGVPFKLFLVLASSLFSAAVMTGSVAADNDDYQGVPFHPFTLDGSNGTCVDYIDPVVGATRNCDPVNLIFPGRTWEEVQALLVADGWSTCCAGTNQSLHYGTSQLYREDAQLVKPDRYTAPRYHIRLWQAPGDILVTFAAVHHEYFDWGSFNHVIDMDWDQAEAAVASALCGPSCDEPWPLPLQSEIQGDDGTWRMTGSVDLRNDAEASVIPAPSTTNHPPIAANDSYSTSEDTPLSQGPPGVLANDGDADNDPLTVALVSDVFNGALTLNPDGSFLYTPDAGFNGNDSFTYVANDGTSDSDIATATIAVNPVNDPPAAVDDGYTIDEDTSLNIAAPGVLDNDADPEGDTLTALLVADVSNGVLTLSADGSFLYGPHANFNGNDSFTYVANDGTAASNAATVTIAVNPINDSPTAVDDGYTTVEDAPLSVAAPGVLGNDSDADGDTLSVALVDNVANGVLTLNPDGSFLYTPDAGFNGNDSFTYLANDGAVDSDIATVTIAVNQITYLPVAVNDFYSTDEDVPLNVPAPGVLGNDSDADGDPLTALLVTDVGNGVLALNPDGSFLYTPDAGFNGDDGFTYLVNDGTGDSNVATVTISVNPVIEPPPSVDQTALGEAAVAGTVAGSFVDTQAQDGSVQAITERESGGKKTDRHSFLEHQWTFNVQSGDSVTFLINAWQSASADGDNFILAYSTDDVTYLDMVVITKTSDDGNYQSFALPPTTSGLVYVRVRDTDQAIGNRFLDTFTVDHMFIRTVAQSATPPAAPTNLMANAISASQIDLIWTDNATNESGFRIERSPDGATWSEIDNVGPDQTTYSDMGLSAGTSFYYRVQAFNGRGNSGYSNTASADTLTPSGVTHVHALTGSALVTGPGGKWQATVTITIHDENEAPVQGATVVGLWSDGASAVSCDIPTDDNGNCSITRSRINGNVAFLEFTVTDIVHDSMTYDQAGDSIVISRP